MQKLVWRVKLVADLGAGPAAEIEVAQIERQDRAVPETLGLTLVEGKQITAAIQTEMVRAQASIMASASNTVRIASWPCPARDTDP